MNKAIFLGLLVILFLGACTSKNKEEEPKRKNIYVEFVNFPEDIRPCLENNLFNEAGNEKGLAIFRDYNYMDAKVLPDNNLLDNTMKFKITLKDEKDSIGNPAAFSVELFKTERSNWKRVANSGHNPFYIDSVLTSNQICDYITGSIFIYTLKFGV